MSIQIYTDGGCSGNPGRGGWAYIILCDGGRREASGGEAQTTNNRMELAAVIESLLEVKRHPDWVRQAIDLYTDSRYVQLGISSWIHTWLKNGWRTASKQPVKNRELWQALYELTHSVPVRWHWLQGHAGHPLNEACDSLVREAIRSSGS